MMYNGQYGPLCSLVVSWPTTGVYPPQLTVSTTAITINCHLLITTVLYTASTIINCCEQWSVVNALSQNVRGGIMFSAAARVMYYEGGTCIVTVTITHKYELFKIHCNADFAYTLVPIEVTWVDYTTVDTIVVVHNILVNCV